MKTEAARFAAEMRADVPIQWDRPHGRWLSLLGTSGAGKTMLANAVFRYMFDHGSAYEKRLIWQPGEINGVKLPAEDRGTIAARRRIYWCDWRTACREMKRGNFGTIEMICDPKDIWFCVIDDIGAGGDADRNYIVNALGDIVAGRLHAWTMFTSNLGLDDLGKLDARIASRMLRENNVCVEVDVEDWTLRTT